MMEQDNNQKIMLSETMTTHPIGVRFTKRDTHILRFINDFGFCEIPHFEKRFGLKKPYSYKVLNRLVEMGLLNYERIFYSRHGIFRLTQAGAAFTDLPPLNKVALATYHHDCAVIDLYLQLRQQYPQALWISERHLKHDQFKTGVGKEGHIPDGLLLLADGKQIAIEVELTCKNKQRLERILKNYAAQLKTHAVWYFCSNESEATIRTVAKDWPFVTIHNLQGYLT